MKFLIRQTSFISGIFKKMRRPQPVYGAKIFQQQSWLTKQVNEELSKQKYYSYQ